MNNKIFLASDHGGFSLKNSIFFFLKEKNINVVDLGCESLDPVDYPDYAQLLASKIEDNNSFGIIFQKESEPIMRNNQTRSLFKGIIRSNRTHFLD